MTVNPCSMDEPTLLQTPTLESPLNTIRLSSEHELELERQAVRKLDCTILPVVALIYVLAILDRTNIGNARVAHLQKDLHLTDEQYQICLTVLFVPYICSELPSNLLFRKIGPGLFLPTLLTIWGIIAALQGLVTSYGSLIAVRVLLGLVEGPMAPGVVLYLSSFYTRDELSFRIALFVSGGSLSGAFSGLLAAAISRMEGIGGRSGWSWIFIIEGLFSVLMGVVSYFLIPSTLRDSRFLTEHQKDIIMKRLEKDRPAIKLLDRFYSREVLRSITSPHVIIVLIMGFMLGTTIYAIELFLPSIVNQLGFTPTKTQLLSVGPFITGFIVTLIFAHFSDHYNSRGIPIVLASMLAIAGFAIFLTAEHKFTSYGSLYLIVSGIYATFPILNAWMANNSELHYRRATTIALYVIVTNAAGILSTWSFPTNEGPKFTKTTVMNLIFCIILLVCSLVNMLYLSWRNKVKQRPEVRTKLLEKHLSYEKKGEDGRLSAWLELGDKHPDFVYTL